MITAPGYDTLLQMGLCCFKGGGGSGAGGGGGASGKVDFPTDYKSYLKDMMRNLSSDHRLDAGISMVEAIEDAWDHSPYDGAQVFDPSDLITANQDRYDDYDALVANLSPAVDWASFIDTVKAKYDSDLYNLTYINDLVAAYDERQAAQSEQAIGRFAAGMADIGAENSTGFIFGMALLQNERVRESARYQRELAAAIYKDRMNFVVQGVQDMTRFMMHQVDAHRVSASLQIETNRIAIVAQKEYLDRVTEIDQLDACWNMTIFQNGANLLAAGQGAAATTLTDSRRDGMPGSSIGGALSGAAAGAMSGAAIGSIVPGIGTAIGAAIGGVMGGVGGSGML